MVDVAELAGVAVSTVSRAVNGDPTVGVALAERVHEAIATLGWEADDRARHLRLGMSGIIGAAVTGLSSPFLHEAERAARAVGLMVLATSTENDERLESEAVRSLTRRRVDGLIVEQRTSRPNGYLRQQIAHGVPVVAIDQPLSGMEADSVICDNVRGIELAYAHLTGRGHRRIAYLGDDERLFTGLTRAAAFRRCATADGHDRHPAVYTGEPSRERVGHDLAAALARRPRPTALITGNAQTTVEVFQVLGTGLGGFELVGFDDLELASIVDPPRSVIAQDYVAMGRAAVEMITSRIREPGLAVRQQVVPVALVDRSGVGPVRRTRLRAPDRVVSRA